MAAAVRSAADERTATWRSAEFRPVMVTPMSTLGDCCLGCPFRAVTGLSGSLSARALHAMLRLFAD